MLRKKLSGLYRKLPIIKELTRIADILAEQNRYANATDLIKLIDFQLAGNSRFNDPKRLLAYQTQVCSQGHEDGIIREIFKRIGTTSRKFVEVGVGNGKENNTAFLLTQGWSGYWIDGNPAFRETIMSRSDLSSGCLKCHVGFVTRENIVEIFQSLGVTNDLDMMSLDIDQNTYYVWEALGDYKARVVVVEYNSVIPADLEWKVNYDASRVWDGSQNMGASLKSLELLGRKLGYSLVGCDFAGNNAFFVRSDLATSDKFAEPFTAENHYEPSRFTSKRYHSSEILDRHVP